LELIQDATGHLARYQGVKYPKR